MSIDSIVFAQRQPDPNQGNEKFTQWGILDGNRVRTLYSNHGEITRWPDQPSGEWPKGTGQSYVDGIAIIVSAETTDDFGHKIHPMSTNYREFIDTDPETGIPWGWAPVPGYSNPIQDSPARSDVPDSCPSFWPDIMFDSTDPVRTTGRRFGTIKRLNQPTPVGPAPGMPSSAKV